MLEGNYLRRKRANFSMSVDVLEMLEKVALRRRISMSAVLTLLVVDEFDRIFGFEDRPVLRPVIKDAKRA